MGIAIFDIISHLTDKQRMPANYLQNYLNLDSSKDAAEFKYVFVFDGDELIYEYRKKNPDYLVDESLSINGKKIIYFNFFDRENNFVDESILGNLKIELLDNRLSVIKYIYRNSSLDPSSPLYKMMVFVDNMLWCRCLSDGDNYCGFTNGVAFLIESIYQYSKKDALESFLRENGVDYKLEWRLNKGMHEFMVVYPSGKEAPFLALASTGTATLLLYFYWSIAFDKISFLFIDEFDAFLHYESAKSIIMRLNKNRSFQSLVTTHNTYLMQNKLTRTDCCFLMSGNGIKSLRDSTSKEIREAHNLEKMYINGIFAK